jgi:hypothetical protein
MAIPRKLISSNLSAFQVNETKPTLKQMQLKRFLAAETCLLFANRQLKCLKRLSCLLIDLLDYA